MKLEEKNSSLRQIYPIEETKQNSLMRKPQ